MAFTASKKTASDFNGGNRYQNGNGLSADTINNLVEGLLYAQENGNTESDETQTTFFECTTSTTYNKIVEAFGNGKIPYYKNGDNYYVLTKYETLNQYFEFAYTDGYSISIAKCHVTLGWSTSTFNIQDTSYKVNSITENSTDTQYPSAKAVYTALQAHSSLPTVSTSDNGKFLRVVDGAWAAESVESAESTSF